MTSSDELEFINETDDESALADSDSWLVLIVDDDEDVHQTTKLSLKKLRFQGRSIRWISAFNGKEALEIICKEGSRLPDLVLMDMVMATPHDGIDTVHAFRKSLNQKNIPFVIIRTGQAGFLTDTALRNDPDVDMVVLKESLNIGMLRNVIERGLEMSKNRGSATERVSH